MADTLKREGLVHPENSSAVGGVSLPAHTPGPWAHDHRDWDGEEAYWTRVYPVSDPGNPVASLHWAGFKHEDGRTITSLRDRNARLIAAAPDLYDVVRRLVEGVDRRQTEITGLVRDARAAIAKALGQEDTTDRQTEPREDL